MTHVLLPPESTPRANGTFAGGWWHREGDTDRITCDLCPRECCLKPGDRGFCFVRANQNGEMVLTSYGRSTGFCVDPIEKKPLNHFLPGTSVLSFGTAGCNLGCKFCQNWDISKSREIERLSELAMPETIARAARQLGCRSVAYTYNDPVVWAEYAIDTAKACRELGIKSVAVTAGYISPCARQAFYQHMDAANVDLKAFTEEFYHKITYSHLQPVLDTLEWLKKETSVWFEITNLVIPQANDSLDEIRRMCDWILERVGPDVPLHFTAFHPDFRMLDRPATPRETLIEARRVALEQGLRFVYVGNVDDVQNQSTYCPSCRGLLIERNWYELGQYQLRGNACGHCGTTIAGVFDERPGDWGRKRVPVRISEFAGATPQVVQIETKREQPRMSSSPAPSDHPAGATSRAATTTAVPEPPPVHEEQQRVIHLAATEIMQAEVRGLSPKLSDPTLAGAADVPVMGVFTTLKRQGRLRGCCGSLGRPMPIIEALWAAATRTATGDVRLPSVSPTELPFLDLDVTLLYNFLPVTARGSDREHAIHVGRHGLQIRRQDTSGLLLPSVATENRWDSRKFLDQVCRKAGLPTGAWRDDATQLVTFEGLSFGGPLTTDADAAIAPGGLKLSESDVGLLANHCRGNLLALVRGAAPDYFLVGGPDGTVAGISLEIVFQDTGPRAFSTLSLRPGVPLQTTLFQLTEAAAASVASRRPSAEQLKALDLRLAILTDPAMHGTVAEPDLRGIDARRATLVIEGNRAAWSYDASLPPRQRVETAATAAASSGSASVFSLAVSSTARSMTVSTAPRPQPGAASRPPAVAGTFYPADADELSRLVASMLPRQAVERRAWSAVMLPHAGLIYSGRIAAATLARVEIPDTVIVIGPKHTRQGVEWAVAPHAEWRVPGAVIASDMELARQLAAAIPGLELDAAAHAQEHGIEVELPFLARLAPHARVVGITIGGGDLARCRGFAAGLASVIERRAMPPLLVISSDMNHYAPDEENRRLDEIAIQALETLDPDRLHATVTENEISMCGLLPAVIVFETLRRRDRLAVAERVGYATSADVTGDKSRVVGYAGMLFGPAPPS